MPSLRAWISLQGLQGDVLAAASIFPDAFDQTSIEAICSRSADTSLQVCIDCGLQRQIGGMFSFRHELARQAIEHRFHLSAGAASTPGR